MAQRATTIGQGARQQQKQHKSSSFLAALLAIRYVQQAAILTWKNCEQPSKRWAVPSHLLGWPHSSVGVVEALDAPGCGSCLRLHVMQHSHVTNYPNPRQQGQAAVACLKPPPPPSDAAAVVPPLCSAGRMEEPTGNAAAPFGTFCLSAAGAAHPAGPGRQQQKASEQKGTTACILSDEFVSWHAQTVVAAPMTTPTSSCSHLVHPGKWPTSSCPCACAAICPPPPHTHAHATRAGRSGSGKWTRHPTCPSTPSPPAMTTSTLPASRVSTSCTHQPTTPSCRSAYVTVHHQRLLLYLC